MSSHILSVCVLKELRYVFIPMQHSQRAGIFPECTLIDLGYLMPEADQVFVRILFRAGEVMAGTVVVVHDVEYMALISVTPMRYGFNTYRNSASSHGIYRQVGIVST